MNKNPLVFISYSHGKDNIWRDRLHTQLQGFAWTTAQMKVFVDMQMMAGEPWRDKIDEAMSQTTVAVLLVSPHFLSSKFIQEVELPRFLERHRQTNMPIIPIIVEPCAWQETKIADFLVRPEDGYPLSGFAVTQQQEVLVKIAREINSLYVRQIEQDDRITIVIADDREFTVRGLRDLFDDDLASDMTAVGLGSTPDEAERALVEFAPDILLLDLSWFRNDQVGFQIMDKVDQLSPRTKIIAMSNHHDLLKEAQRRGVATLDKDFSVMELFTTVRDVHNNRPRVVNKKTVFDDLTDRERDVLSLVADGFLDKEAAAELGVSLSTVKKHMSNIIAKTGVRSRTEAAVKAKEYGII